MFIEQSTVLAWPNITKLKTKEEWPMADMIPENNTKWDFDKEISAARIIVCTAAAI